jgi:Zn-dependent protease
MSIDRIIQLAILFLSIILHEIAHGYMAYRLGDPTARDAKRLTLNPLAHVDPFGTILLPLILVITRSPVLLGWAKPVPYNPAYFRDYRKGTMLVGAAGPVTNLILATAAGVLVRVLGPAGSPLLILVLVNACAINVVLAIFNLIPIPPLDGSRVLVGFMPRDWIPGYLFMERFGFLVIFGLLYLGLLDRLLLPVEGLLLRMLLPLP